jgi:hypothetical protein
MDQIAAFLESGRGGEGELGRPFAQYGDLGPQFRFDLAQAIERAGRYQATGISEASRAGQNDPGLEFVPINQIVQIGGPVQPTSRHEQFVFQPSAQHGYQETGPSSQEVDHAIQMRLHLQHMRQRRSTYVPRDIRQRRRRAEGTEAGLQGIEREQQQSRRESERRLEVMLRDGRNGMSWRDWEHATEEFRRQGAAGRYMTLAGRITRHVRPTASQRRQQHVAEEVLIGALEGLSIDRPELERERIEEGSEDAQLSEMMSDLTAEDMSPLQL